MAETNETLRSTSGERRLASTFCPSNVIVAEPPGRAVTMIRAHPTADTTARSSLSPIAASVAARYNRPVSRNEKIRRRAKSEPAVDLPELTGPSIATFKQSTSCSILKSYDP